MSPETKSPNRFKKSIVLVIIFFLCVTVHVSAFPPTFILGSSLDYNDADDNEDQLWYGLYGVGSWRSTIGQGGYTALSGNFNARYSDEESRSFDDSESLKGTLGFPVPAGMLLIESAISSSFDDVDYGTVLRPQWSTRYNLWKGPHYNIPLSPYLIYSGFYLYQELGVQDRFSHEIGIGVTYDPSIKIGYRFELTGKAELWNGDYTEDLSEFYTLESTTKRTDVATSAEVEVNGLAGYFADWSVLFRGGSRLSNDEQYLSDDLMETEGTDTFFVYTEGVLSWSPTRQIGLSSSLYAEVKKYMDRNAYADDGSLGSTPLSLLDVGGNLEFDWTPNNKLYFLGSVSGYKTFSDGPNYDGWNYGVSVGIEYGF